MKANNTETNGHTFARERERYEAKEQRPKSTRQLRRQIARTVKLRRSNKSSSLGF